MTMAMCRALTGQSGGIAWETLNIPPNTYLTGADAAQVRIYNYNGSSSSHWEQLTPLGYGPTPNCDPTLNSVRWGIELQISRRARGKFPNDAVYWFKMTPGATGLVQQADVNVSDWSPKSDPHLDVNGTPTKWFPFMYDKILQARDALLQNSLRRVPRWETHFRQGEETDCMSWQSVNALAREMDVFHGSCRQILGNADMRIVIVRTHINSLAHIDTSADAVNRVAAVRGIQEAFCAKDRRAAWVNQDDLQMVNGHLAYTAIDTLGDRCFNAEQSLG